MAAAPLESASAPAASTGDAVATLVGLACAVDLGYYD